MLLTIFGSSNSSSTNSSSSSSSGGGGGNSFMLIRMYWNTFHGHKIITIIPNVFLYFCTQPVVYIVCRPEIVLVRLILDDDYIPVQCHHEFMESSLHKMLISAQFL